MRNTALLSVFAAIVVLPVGVVACGSTTVVDAPAPAPTDTATTPVPTVAPTATGPTVPDDHGAISTTYPAFPPAMAQLVDNGGRVLTNPVVVTVTWDGDTNADLFESVGDTIGSGTYWSQVTSEYGAHAATSGADYHIRLTTAPPASMSTDELDTFVAARLADGTFPAVAAGGNAVYTLYLSPSTSLQIDGSDACSQGVGGYHDSTKTGPVTAYAIVPQCKASDIEETTLSASHELAEATTDPYPMSTPAWYGFRDQDLAFTLFQQFQVENGDACEFYRDSTLPAGAESGLAFTVQRQWSNKSAAAGHAPCVPAFANQVFYNTTPLGLEDVDVDLSQYGYGSGSVTTKGYSIPVGGSKVIGLGFYSDGDLKPWTIEADAGGIAARSSANVDLKLDVTTGQNGQKAYLTVTVNTAGRTGTELITIKSTYNGNSHYMPLLIASPAK